MRASSVRPAASRSVSRTLPMPGVVARVLAEDRGIRCVVLDYDAMRGVDDVDSRLF